jgi:hypothetical protein
MLNKGALAASVAAAAKVYVEDVFSTWLYAGNSSTQTITNGVDLAGNGGMVWIKARNQAFDHTIVDTVRGGTKRLASNLTSAQSTESVITLFGSAGFTLGTGFENPWNQNNPPTNYASWTFRKAAKFFDVVTFTAGTNTNRRISHSLGSVPGLIIIKSYDTAGQVWPVYHRSTGRGSVGVLNSTQEFGTALPNIWGTSDPTATDFGFNETLLATPGANYVAYLFAHDAGGFGDSGNSNVVSCGSYTGNGSAAGPTVTLGWEPQWLMIKRTDVAYDWWFCDNMRGMVVGGNDQSSLANTTNTEQSFDWMAPTATGFELTTSNVNFNASGGNYVYIAIRRGPMKTPTDATKVFGLSARTGTGANATVTGGQVDDAVLIKNRGSAVGDLFAARLTNTGYLETSSTVAEVAAGTTILQANSWDVMDGVKVGTTSTITNASANTFINYLFRRAPGFFDVVTYTGTGVARTVNHNLGVAPELMIVKQRNAGQSWLVYSAFTGNTAYLMLNSTSPTEEIGSLMWNSTSPTSTVFSLGTTYTNGSGGTYINYLFASCPGVSKVGSYTGTGTTLDINCGFATGARFVMIKRTNSIGSWYVWDTTRGIVSGNDPYLLLESTAAEVTNTDYIDPLSSGFQISSTAPAAINASGGSYIYLSIA